jgi:hypothetical protein
VRALIGTNGTVTAVYSDKLPIAKLGEDTITRASNVEFNHTTKKWEAEFTNPEHKKIQGDKRDEVIAQEVALLEQNLHKI